MEKNEIRDGLTNLLLKGQYEEDYKNAKQDDLCIVYFDINNLKHTNDTLGHRYGDKLIIAASEALTANFRDENIYRTGGDEFIVLANGIGPKVIEERLKRINATLDEATKNDEDGLIYQIASGYCVGDGIMTKREIEDKAESLMYQNKKMLKAMTQKKVAQSTADVLAKAKAELSISKKPVKAEEEKAENAKQKPVEVRPIPLVDKFKTEINAEPFIASGVILFMFAVLVVFLIFA